MTGPRERLTFQSLRSIAAVQGTFVQFADLMVNVVIEGFFDVGFAEVVVIFHGGDGSTAGAVDAGEESESKTNVLRRQCFAMVPLAFDIRYVLNWVSLSGQYQLSGNVAKGKDVIKRVVRLKETYVVARSK